MSKLDLNWASIREDLFWAKVHKTESCWLWTASRNQDGYGQFRVEQDMCSPHRIVWVLTYGPIPEGLLVCHHCDVPHCVNPEHLFLGTDLTNTKDRVAKGRKSGYAPGLLAGAKNPMAVLNGEDYKKIFALRESGMLQREIGAVLGVRQSTVSRILNGVRWQNWTPTNV